MNFTEFIDPALLVLIPVLNLIGWAIKKTEKIDNKHIPLLLGAVGIILAILWALASSDIAGYQDALTTVFKGLTQGVGCAGTAVLNNQVYKQEVAN